MQPNKCRAIVSIGDDHGDNSCTFHCQLESGHEGLHSEKFENSGKNLTMTWDGSEKVKVERYKFKITRSIIDFSDSPIEVNTKETLITDLVSYSELSRKYGGTVEGSESLHWMLDEAEEIEGSLETEFVYADEVEG